MMSHSEFHYNMTGPYRVKYQRNIMGLKNQALWYTRWYKHRFHFVDIGVGMYVGMCIGMCLGICIGICLGISDDNRIFCKKKIGTKCCVLILQLHYWL